ncbi:hypothetical protein DPMN_008478 [Dreissena polymorpha]|uniref:Uncharacterized protein n=1 Tax=Dreissena polymorpha TaxID=45954 RepID=A0A9D4MV74_DREPO|nr:hypothetical protein DPMN_008478 [Dreissena polymorpha]
MPSSTWRQVVHTQGVKISRDPSESGRTKRKEVSVNNSKTRAAKVKAQEEYTKANRSEVLEQTSGTS